jgi:hypothetical protein
MVRRTWRALGNDVQACSSLGNNTTTTSTLLRSSTNRARQVPPRYEVGHHLSIAGQLQMELHLRLESVGTSTILSLGELHSHPAY